MRKGRRYSFMIVGNQEKPKGNPLPYHRTTQGSFWNAGSRRYSAWKEYVQSSFMKEMRDQLDQQSMSTLELVAIENKGKPIVLWPNEEASIQLDVHWHNNAHSDLDNVLKGILDALFVNDKGVTSIAARSAISANKVGSVSVTIEILTEDEQP